MSKYKNVRPAVYIHHLTIAGHVDLSIEDAVQVHGKWSGRPATFIQFARPFDARDEVRDGLKDRPWDWKLEVFRRNQEEI